MPACQTAPSGTPTLRRWRSAGRCTWPSVSGEQTASASIRHHPLHPRQTLRRGFCSSTISGLLGSWALVGVAQFVGALEGSTSPQDGMTHSPSPGCPALTLTELPERLPRPPSEEPAWCTSLRGVGAYSKFRKGPDFPQ